MKRIVPVIVLMFFLASGSVLAADAELGIDFNSAYVWRGITFNDGWVAQPSMTVEKGGFSFNVWGNYDIDDYDGVVNDYDFSEIDLTVAYTFPSDTVQFTVGLINYLFPGTDAPSTTELFTRLGVGGGMGWSAAVTFYYDVDEVDSYYTDFSLAYAKALTHAVTMEFGATIGYAGNGFAQAYSGGERGFYDYGLSLKLTYAITKALSFGASVYYADNVDDDALPDALVDKNLYGGMSIVYAF
jgi:hypothetical protein